jgi:hypothetical protein
MFNGCLQSVGLANKSLVGELLQLRFFKMTLPAKTNFQAVCGAGPQSPQLSR